jgi:hypothetical protein
MVQAPSRTPSTVKPATTPATMRRARYTSYMLITIAALVLLDVGARFSYPYWNMDRYNSPNKSWIWWAVDDFRKQPQAPDVVLLGSSLMLEALNGGDATYLHKPQNVSLHHKSVCLQDNLKRSTNSQIRTFSFAIAGQMASDAYVISSTLLSGKSKPTTIIYGIAPRDFMDNMLTNVTTTETFRYLSRVGDLSNIATSARPSLWEATESALGKVSFLYQHKTDLAYLQQCGIKSFLKIFAHGDLEDYRVPFELRKIAMKEMPEEIASNETLVCPYGDPPVPYLDNLNEYRQRYAHLNKQMFADQVSFLERLLKYGRAQKINVVLVNMPLTADNVATMPPGFYQNYLSTISKLASTYDSKLIDLNQQGMFNRGYFADSAHLNGLGGIRFFTLLSDALTTDHIELRKPK